MANLGRKYRKFVAIGCSHGHLSDRTALKAVLRFVDSYKPEVRIHLGDFTDQTAFRSGAKGTSDETVSIKDDLAAGLNFLREFRPTHLVNGNHEDRLWRLADHYNEIIARAAGSVVTEICDLAREMGAQHIDHYSIPRRSGFEMGGYLWCHGWMYSEQAIRDHAEMLGNCVIAHLHRPGDATGRRSDNPTAYCVGWLGDVNRTDYAKARRATTAWQNGYAWGVIGPDDSQIYLCKRPQNGPWIPPL